MDTEKLSEQRKAMKETTDALINNFIAKMPLKYLSTFTGVPKLHKKAWMNCFEKTSGKTRALKMKCLECSDYTKAEITDCNVRTCPLWNYRPYQKKEN